MLRQAVRTAIRAARLSWHMTASARSYHLVSRWREAFRFAKVSIVARKLAILTCTGTIGYVVARRAHTLHATSTDDLFNSFHPYKPRRVPGAFHAQFPAETVWFATHEWKLIPESVVHDEQVFSASWTMETQDSTNLMVNKILQSSPDCTVENVLRQIQEKVEQARKEGRNASYSVVVQGDTDVIVACVIDGTLYMFRFAAAHESQPNPVFFTWIRKPKNSDSPFPPFEEFWQMAYALRHDIFPEESTAGLPPLS